MQTLPLVIQINTAKDIWIEIIQARFLSDRVEILAKPLAKHINRSKKLSSFPEEYKKAK